MKKATYWRKGNQVGEFDGEGRVDTSSAKDFKSINQAKRHSRELQKGALGQGDLIVIRK